MNKHEFLQILKEELTGQISGQQINENINFYSSYIDGEIASGKSEEQVMAELGDARLIAKTILETAGSDSANQSQNGYYSRANQDNYGKSQEYYRTSQGDREASSQESFFTRKNRDGSEKRYFFQQWYFKLILIFGILLIIGLMFSIVSLTFRVIFKLLKWPIICILIIAFFYFRSRRR